MNVKIATIFLSILILGMVGYLAYDRYNKGLVALTLVTTCNNSEPTSFAEYEGAISSNSAFSANGHTITVAQTSNCQNAINSYTELKKIATQIVRYNDTTVVTVTPVEAVTDENGTITVNATTKTDTTTLRTFYWCSEDNKVILSVVGELNVMESYFSTYYQCKDEDICNAGDSDCGNTTRCVDKKCVQIAAADCPAPFNIANHKCNSQCTSEVECQLSESCEPSSIKWLNTTLKECKTLVCEEKQIPQEHVCVDVQCNLDEHCFLDSDINCDSVSERVNGTCNAAANHTCIFPSIVELTTPAALQMFTTFDVNKTLTMEELNEYKCSSLKILWNTNRWFIIIGGLVLIGGIVGFVVYKVKKK